MIDIKQINAWNPPLPLTTNRGVHNYMSTPTIYGILRHLCEETGGPYLEIGSYRGMGLVACSEICTATGIDNFTGVGYRVDNYEILQKQIEGRDAVLFRGDYLDVCAILEDNKSKFGVIFVDGPHDKGDTANQLQAVRKLIKKGGFIVVDDYNGADVKAEVKEFAAGRGFELLFEQVSPRVNHKIWWRGIAVIRKK
jgi:predicted O-methyltransferase YrrM